MNPETKNLQINVIKLSKILLSIVEIVEKSNLNTENSDICKIKNEIQEIIDSLEKSYNK